MNSRVFKISLEVFSNSRFHNLKIDFLNKILYRSFFCENPSWLGLQTRDPRGFFFVILLVLVSELLNRGHGACFALLISLRSL